MKNIVKNELIVQHDTFICDPFSAEFTTRQRMVKSCGVSVVKMFLNSCYMSSRVYIYIWIDFTPTGQVQLFAMLVSGCSKICFKNISSRRSERQIGIGVIKK